MLCRIGASCVVYNIDVPPFWQALIRDNSLSLITMFEAAELGRRVSRAEYRRRVPILREALLEAQCRLHEHVKSITWHACDECVWLGAVYNQRLEDSLAGRDWLVKSDGRN